MHGADFFRCFRVCLLFLAIVPAVAVADDTIATAQFLHGSEFVRELDKPLSVTRDKAELRPLLQRLSVERRIAIALDRRIDPNLEIDAQLPAMTVRAAIEEIAARSGAILRVIGNTLIVGPDPNIGQLRTICALRDMELDDFQAAPGNQRSKLARKHTVAWDDLDRPADVVTRICELAELEVEGLNLIPHDLWAQGVLVELTTAEALSWVLVQYDLAFAWTGTATGVRIVELTAPAAITIKHRVTISKATALQRVRDRFPDLDAQIENNWIVATGLVEQHDVIGALARGENPTPPPKAVEFGALAKRRFTLRVVRQPASAVLTSLQKSGIDLRIDAAALTAQKIDLNQRISLQLKQATIQEMLQAICEPAGATFEVDGEAIHIPARN